MKNSPAATALLVLFGLLLALLDFIANYLPKFAFSGHEGFAEVLSGTNEPALDPLKVAGCRRGLPTQTHC